MSSPSRKRRRAEQQLTQDFELLASKYSDFGQEWRLMKSKNGPLASKATPTFQLALTRAMLDFHFGLKMPSLPENRLCPPIPNRWFYCEWVLQELMPSLTNPQHFETVHDTKNYGLDIGTGASAIYPLLLVNQDSKLRMLASEVDTVSIQSAKTNTDANNLQDRVTFVIVDQHQSDESNSRQQRGPLLQALKQTGINCLDFIVTNPPFFDERPPARADGRDRTPMTDAEGLYPGGEVGWVLDILRDSLTTRTQIGWYTTMLCKKTSFQTLHRILVNFLGPGHVRSTELDVGCMTRWFLAWTYNRVHSKSPAARAISDIDFQIQLEECEDPTEEVAERVKVYCESIPGWDITCTKTTQQGSSIVTVTEKFPPSTESLMVEEKEQEKEQLPDRAVQGLSDLSCLGANNWLPTDGHFLVDVRIVEEKDSPSVVVVKAEVYRHSSRGRKAIEKILSRMEGEVSRTNRRWRRLLAKQLEPQPSTRTTSSI
jgi:23S rRNA A1618 N6-methylase RlmF